MLTAGHRIYFAAVGALAIWVGVWGYFVPSRVERAIPFPVPPLHSRLLGAMYLSGFVLMLGSLGARRWSQLTAIPVMTAIWTGGLLLVSFLYLDEFDFAESGVWIWFAAYILYPVVAVWLAYRYGASRAEGGASVPGWARRYLVVQGVLLCTLAVALFVAPGPMADGWPWPITEMLAQIYAAPFLAYGVGSLLIARRRRWVEIRLALVGMLVFAVGVLVASVIHSELFSGRDVGDVVWFGGFAVACAALAALSARSLAAGGEDRRPSEWSA